MSVLESWIYGIYGMIHLTVISLHVKHWGGLLLESNEGARDKERIYYNVYLLE